MEFDPGNLTVAIGGAVATIIGSWALYTRARIAGGAPLLVLRRLWDWIEGNGLDTDVPASLRRDVRREINADDTEDTHDAPG